MSKPNLVHDPYWNRYINLVPEEDIAETLQQQANDLSKLLGGIDEERSTHRYAPEKWSIKQVVSHLSDMERVFSYRALSIARGETRSLPGVDEQMFAATAEADRRPFREILDELLVVRGGTIALARSLTDAAWERVGTANDSKISARSLVYVAAGHARHHMGVLRERYGV